MWRRRRALSLGARTLLIRAEPCGTCASNSPGPVPVPGHSRPALGSTVSVQARQSTMSSPMRARGTAFGLSAGQPIAGTACRAVRPTTASSGARGWQGSAQYLFLQQRPGSGDCGIEGQDAGPGPGTTPMLYNLTIIGSAARDLSGGADGCGIRLHTGASMKARNVIVTGFASRATEVRDRSAASFRDGTRSIAHAIVRASGGQEGDLLIEGDIEIGSGYLDEDPKLVNVRFAANPDPRPRLFSSALKVGAGAVPPSNGTLDTDAQQIGAFSESNWLEEWTFFGPESDYRLATLYLPD